jgi:ParB family chromosome partitioning protein
MTMAAEKVTDKTLVEKAAVEKSVTEKRVAEKTVVEKRRALGRGLESLLPGPRAVPLPVSVPAADQAADLEPAGLHPDGRPGALRPSAQGQASVPTQDAAAAADVVAEIIPGIQAQAAVGDQVLHVRLDQLEPNPYQTRSRMSEEDLEELAESIQANGVLQPVIVRLKKDSPKGDTRYVLIAGERRWRASQLAKLETIPAMVRQVSNQQAMEMTIIENLQRQDLNCMDQARAFSRMSQEFGLTQEEIGRRTGCARETVSNYMRLLKLPGRVQGYLDQGQIDFSHARLLLRLQDPLVMERMAERVITKHLSPDQLEWIVMDVTLPVEGAAEARRSARWVDPNVRAAQTDLQRLLGVRVKIRDRRGKGKITIEYASLEDFDRVITMLKGKRE